MISQTSPQRASAHNLAPPLPKLGFLGLGWIGRRRLEAIAGAHIAEIVALADPMPAALERCKSLAPQAEEAAGLEELLDLDLDGIIIATPSALHAGQALAALEHGRAVFCQKPLGRNAGEVRTIVEAARQADRLLGVDLSYRHIRGMAAIRALIQSGALGRVFAADLIFHNAYGPDKAWFYDPVLSGGGCVTDLGIHLVDLLLWTLGGPVTGVQSCIFSKGQPLSLERAEVEDYAQAQIFLGSGTVASLACSWCLHAGRNAVIEANFYGTEGGAALRNVNGSFTEFRAERFTGTLSEVLAEPPDEWGGQAATAWVRQLAESTRFDPEVESQIEVASVLDAIYGRNSAQPLLHGGRL